MIAGSRMKPRRAPLEIQMHMLQILRTHGRLGPTRLMYTANLSWDLMLFHLKILVENKLVQTEPSNKYSLTQRGIECVNILEQGALMIGPLKPIYPTEELGSQTRYLDGLPRHKYKYLQER